MNIEKNKFIRFLKEISYDDNGRAFVIYKMNEVSLTFQIYQVDKGNHFSSVSKISETFHPNISYNIDENYQTNISHKLFLYEISELYFYKDHQEWHLINIAKSFHLSIPARNKITLDYGDNKSKWTFQELADFCFSAVDNLNNSFLFL